LRTEWRWEDPDQAVLLACSGLIAVVEDEDGSRVVQFSHFSVKEFLTSERLIASSLDVLRFYIALEPAHTIMARVCLGTLLQLDDIYDEDDVEKKFPLARYAAEHWFTHAQFDDTSSHIREGMQLLFDPDKPYFSAWIRVYDIGVKHTADTSRLWRPPPYHKSDASPLYYAVLCGFRDLARCLIQEFSQPVNAIGGDGCTGPLHLAARHGHADLSQMLLVGSAGRGWEHSAAFGGPL